MVLCDVRREISCSFQPLINGSIAAGATRSQNETIGDGWSGVCGAAAPEKVIIVHVEVEMGGRGRGARPINHHL